MEYEDDTLVIDRRWNIDFLAAFLSERLPDEAQVEMANVAQMTKLQRDLALKVINAASRLAGVIAAEPIPFADMPLITATQVAMVTAVARIGGQRVDARGVTEFITGLGLNVGVGMGFRGVVRGLSKLIPIPIVNSATSVAMAVQGTKMIGHAAMAYYINGSSAKEAFEKARREAAPTV
jgi:uncharacterized protein (DUF697 family)